MSELIQILINTNTINFLIVLCIVLFLIKKLNLSQQIDNVKNNINSYVELSEQEKIQSETELSRINDKITKLPAVIERIMRSTEKNVQNIAQNVMEDTEEKKKDISKNAQRLFNLETKKFKSRLTSILSEKSVELAKENAINQLKENPSLHEKYINSAIDEIDRIQL